MKHVVDRAARCFFHFGIDSGLHFGTFDIKTDCRGLDNDFTALQHTPGECFPRFDLDGNELIGRNDSVAPCKGSYTGNREKPENKH